MIVGLQMFADHPILGVGLGNYPLLYQQYSQRLGIDLRSEIRQAHNLYLEVAAETGLLGLLSFGLLLVVMFWSIWKAHQALAKKGLIFRFQHGCRICLWFPWILDSSLFYSFRLSA